MKTGTPSLKETKQMAAIVIAIAIAIAAMVRGCWEDSPSAGAEPGQERMTAKSKSESTGLPTHLRIRSDLRPHLQKPKSGEHEEGGEGEEASRGEGAGAMGAVGGVACRTRSGTGTPGRAGAEAR